MAIKNNAHHKPDRQKRLLKKMKPQIRRERLKEKKLSLQEKELETAEALNKAQSEFVATVSHELRTPLAIIKQLLLLIFDEVAGPINDQQREILVKARYNIERLKHMIDALLDVARLERESFSLHYSLVNLRELISESQGFFQELAAEKNIKIIYQWPKSNVNIFIDADRIYQAITNLINNAIKFTPDHGKIKIEVKLLETKVRVAIIDTGRGIDKNDLKKLFGKFFQGNVLNGTHGVGLGLFIVQEIIKRHGGEVWVESEPGEGSRFYFTVPRFYTVDVMEKTVKDKINALLDKRVSVHLINLRIVNYDEFKRRVNIQPHAFFEELRKMIDVTFQNVVDASEHNQKVDLPDIVRGRYSIILPEIDAQKVSDFCHQLREKTKQYFVGRNMEGVFIALGMLFYSVQMRTSRKGNQSNLQVKEIYIGSEMRRSRRINYKTKVEIRSRGKKNIVQETIDISPGGICCRLSAPLETDKRVKVKIYLLRKKKSILADARVAWVSKIGPTPSLVIEQYKVGFEFIHLSQKDQALLAGELKLYTPFC